MLLSFVRCGSLQVIPQAAAKTVNNLLFSFFSFTIGQDGSQNGDRHVAVLYGFACVGSALGIQIIHFLSFCKRFLDF
jgi:hypothetical protein